MITSQLIRVLQTFDKKEIRELKKWVNSPAHNLRQDVIDFLEYLTTGNHLFSERQLEKDRIFAAVYPDKTFNDAELRQVMHFLHKAMENFLIYNELLKDEVRSQTMLAKVYRKRQLPKMFRRTIDTGKKIQEQQPFRNHQYFENEYALQFEEYTYLSGQGRNVPLNLQEVSDANDVAYLANKFQLSCIMLSHQAVFKTEYRMKFLEELLKQIENSPDMLEIPAIAIYYYQFRAITTPKDESYYQQLKNEIFKSGHLFPTEEIRVIYLLTINYCIGRINAGMAAFVRESFDLYKEGLDKGIFLENGILSRFTFNNAVTAGLNLKEFSWVENFIQNYSGYLDEKHRENFIHFNKARLSYESGDYNTAMKLFAQSDYDDILMSLNSKTMLLKMYYELNEFNALDSLLGSMKTYLQRKKVMGYHKDNYKNIIQYTKKILKVAPYDKEQKQKLRQELETVNPLTERKWLLAQLETL